ncbi:hypothetical protein HU200_056073 [Digitaria exilis]|uniref:Uncharacterized protein n=1 Tax=Digitaria exilis TaxID=1010633 RepID=A0A835ALX7_9POAL|nr:hypothetical protein HU200_056073 [Digitaria exilis]
MVLLLIALGQLC